MIAPVSPPRMADVYVTQCPKCQTRFRITKAQLGIAQGVVRCGACKCIFSAAKQLGLQPPAASTPAAAPKPAAPTDSTAAANKTLYLSSAESAPVAPQPAARTAHTHTDIAPIPLHTHDPVTQEAPLDARQAHQTSRLDLDDFDLDEALATLPPEHWELAPKGARRHTVPPSPHEPRTAHTTTTSGLHAPSSDNALETANVGRLSAEREGDAAPSPPLRHESLRSLQDEPLQLKRTPHPPRWGRRVFWGSLFVGVLAVLPAQYLYLNFDGLSRQEAWRPWLKQGCRIVGCHLPALVNIDLVRSTNLVVRTHPERPGALKVDAILHNRANYPQPFPILELRFADFNGQNLSSLRFKPTDYLEGEVKAGDSMPPETPVHIRLEVLDPGVQAAGYSLEFHSPE